MGSASYRVWGMEGARGGDFGRFRTLGAVIGQKWLGSAQGARHLTGLTVRNG